MAIQHLRIEMQINDASHGDLLDLRRNFIHALKANGFEVTTDADLKSIIPPPILVRLFTSDAIENLSSIIFGWLSKDRSRTLRFQIGDKQMEATGLSKKEQQELIDWFKLQAGLSITK
jgi:hypothetical protein